MAMHDQVHVVRTRLGKSGPLGQRGSAPNPAARRQAGGVGRPSNAPAVQVLPEKSQLGGAAAPRANASTAGAPQVGSAFVGTFQTFGPSGQTPPDSAMAVSPNYLVSATNLGGVEIFDKNGDPPKNSPLYNSNSLSGFFAPVGPDAKEQILSDPHVVYDEYLDRFWVLAIAANDNPNLSSYLLALSPPSSQSPVIGQWGFFVMEVNDANGNWCDYPQLGVDAQAIYLTCNMFAFPVQPAGPFQYAHIDVLTKTQFLSGPCCYWWRVSNPGGGGNARTITPAHMRGATAGDGEYLVNAEGKGFGGDQLHVWHITNLQNCCVAGSQSAPTLDDTDQGVASFDTPPAGRQPLSPLGLLGLDLGDTGVLAAVWFQGNLYSTQNTSCDVGACVKFTQLDVSDFGHIATVNDWVLDNEGGDTDTYYGSLDVNAHADVALVFGRSSASSPPGAYVGIIPPASVCTHCIVNSPATLAAGGASYFKLDSNGRNRWGDYFAAAADPDGLGIWVQGESAGPPQQTGGNVTSTNVTTAGLAFGVFDDIAPDVRITLQGTPHNGWYNHDVPFTLTASDIGSGVRFITLSETGAQKLAPTTFSNTTSVTQNPGITAEGKTTITFSATDNWGNVSSCSVGCPVTVQLDKTPPTIAIFAPSNTTYTLNAVVPASYACHDAPSGVATCVGTLPNGANIDTSTLGTRTFTVNASDVAGNTATATVTYTVAYGVSLQYDPTRPVQSGAAYPIRVRLVDANAVNLSSAKVPLTATGIVDSAGNVVQRFSIPFKFDPRLVMYTLPVSTKGLADGTYALTFLALGDPTTHVAPFTVGKPPA
jgi:hypothetical protein